MCPDGTRVKLRHGQPSAIRFNVNNLCDGQPLAVRFAMKTLGMLIALLVTPLQVANAQQLDLLEGAPIESTEVSGLAFDQLSPGLRQDINALVGSRLSRDRVEELAARIEAERPDVVAAIRAVSRPDGSVRVIFLVARISDDQDLASNINARYTVESVEIAGIPETEVSQGLRDDLQALVGNRLDPDEAERLDVRLEAELPGYEVKRRISRGTQSGRIRLIFELSEVEAPPWIRFASSRSKVVYHSKQGWSGVLDIPMGGPRNHRVALGLVFGNDDDLIEEYSGFRLRFESRKVATERLGLSVELSRFRQTWRPETASAVASDPRIPETYRSRLTVEPSVTFAFNPRVRVTAGVSVSELESLSRSPDSQMASSAVASISYDQRWKHKSGFSQNVEASYELRAATTALESDLVFKRHLGRASYKYQRGKSIVTTAVSIGRLTGQAPLFERFSLGDSSTLRGWNKFDIAPAGGDRMFHHLLEYRYRSVAFFVDNGSVWEQDTDVRIRLATGFGFHGENGFVTLGFPLNANDLSATFMMGIRF